MRLGWDRQSDSGEAGPSSNLISLAVQRRWQNSSRCIRKQSGFERVLESIYMLAQVFSAVRFYNFVKQPAPLGAFQKLFYSDRQNGRRKTSLACETGHRKYNNCLFLMRAEKVLEISLNIAFLVSFMQSVGTIDSLFLSLVLCFT